MNKSGKTQPIQTKFGIRGHVKRRQRSGNFGHDRPIIGKMGAKTSPTVPELFCVVNQTTFQQLRNGRFPPNLVWSRNVFQCPVAKSGKIFFFENFHFRVICPQNLTWKLGQTGT